MYLEEPPDKNNKIASRGYRPLGHFNQELIPESLPREAS